MDSKIEVSYPELKKWWGLSKNATKTYVLLDIFSVWWYKLTNGSINIISICKFNKYINLCKYYDKYTKYTPKFNLPQQIHVYNFKNRTSSKPSCFPVGLNDITHRPFHTTEGTAEPRGQNLYMARQQQGGEGGRSVWMRLGFAWRMGSHLDVSG